MADLTFSLGAWLPDLPKTLSAYGKGNIVDPLPLEDAYFLRPGKTSGSYVGFPMNEHASTFNFYPEIATSIFTATAEDGVRYMFVGTDLKLRLFNSGTGDFTDVSNPLNSGGNYTGSYLNYWSFCQYGNRVIATNGTDPVQSYVLGSSSTFENLAGSPPRAKVVFTFGNFVILANLLADADIGTAPAGYRNSAIDDPTNWTTSATTQCDVAILNGDGGEITGGAELSSGCLIFQQRAIWAVNYIGSPVIFNLTALSKNIGAGPRSIVVDQNIAYFWSSKGLFSCNGGEVKSISAGKIDTYIKEKLEAQDVTPNTSAIDPQERYIYWGFSSVDNQYTSPGALDMILVYQIDTGEFTRAGFGHTAIGAGLALAYNLDTIDAISPSGSPGLDVGFDAISFDNPLYSSSLPIIGMIECYDGNAAPRVHWQLFTGAYASGTVTTKALKLHPRKRTQITKVRPIVHSDSTPEYVRVRLDKRETTYSAYTSSSYTAVNSRGWANIRSSGQEHVINISAVGSTVNNDDVEFTGVEIEYNELGER